MNPFKYGCVVAGENFCPRPELERQLKEFAKSGQNLVVQGARRMGKTSLVKHALGSIRGMKLIYVDLYGIRTVAEFCGRVMHGVAKATDEMSFLKKALQFAFRLRPVIAVDPRDGSTTISVDARAAAEILRWRGKFAMFRYGRSMATAIRQSPPPVRGRWCPRCGNATGKYVTANIPASDMPAGFLHTTTAPFWTGFLRRSSRLGGDGKAAAMARMRYRCAKIRGAYRLSRRNIARIVAAKAVLS